MKVSIRKGLGFGLTSGIITTLGLIVGLNAAIGSKMVIIAGILTIAIADAFSDAFGIHISEESGLKSITKREVWESTFATFFSKFIFALSFLIPFLLFNMRTSLIISLVWGLFLITFFSYYIAKIKDTSPSKAILEHILIAGFVILTTNYAGVLIAKIFG